MNFRPLGIALRDCFDTLTGYLTDQCPGESAHDDDYVAWEDFDPDVDGLRSVINELMMTGAESLDDAILEGFGEALRGICNVSNGRFEQVRGCKPLVYKSNATTPWCSDGRAACLRDPWADKFPAEEN